MGVKFKVNKSFNLGGLQLSEVQNLSADAGVPIEVSVPAAKAGSLSVRTDANTGTIVMSSGGHGITTGARVDVYWAGGQRRGVTVGTVSGTSVPIDLGAGDDLPSASTAVIVAVPEVVPVVVTGDDVVGLGMYSAARGQVVIAADDDTELHNKNFEAAGADGWYDGSGETNPLAGDDVAKVYLSHADTAAAKTMRVVLAYN